MCDAWRDRALAAERALEAVRALFDDPNAVWEPGLIREEYIRTAMLLLDQGDQHAATLCEHDFSEAHDFGPLHGQHCPGPADHWRKVATRWADVAVEHASEMSEVRALGIRAARIGKEIAVKHEDDAWLTDLRDIEKDLMFGKDAR